MPKTKLERYIITYLSQVHYEVIGYVDAKDMEEAIEKARKELKEEAKFYDVERAKIAKIGEEKEIRFDIQ